ncbi:iron reductase [Yersinia entomophaga]|uniref:Iron reductase n=1 Tax=Yersinia entomophaga TaxID=935293 RepID=A0ABN4PNV6_YERET|nr:MULTISPECIES: siderophore-iron reductase FhuF [Yersinia]ANI28983.1 iron reductase [Yersinia entomophaga]OWF88791.1 hydroxamate siderophore iron reductase FhuF [Yersinia entomophaga]
MSNTENLITPSPVGVIADIAQLFEQTFAHFSVTFKVNSDNIPSKSMSFNHWSNEDNFPSLMEIYQNEYYGINNIKPNQKALYSLWTQWYFGLVIPPMMLLLMEYPQEIDSDCRNFKVEFHDSGRPDIIYYQLKWKGQSAENLLERYYALINNHVIPIANKIESYQGINGRLLWNNIGYLMYWYLGEFKKRMKEDVYQSVIQGLFMTMTLPDGRENPLYRTVILRNDTLQRRSCCQRNKLPGVGNCHDCPLEITL